MESLVAQILARARSLPEKTSCVFPDGEKISYAELSSGVRAAAKAFGAAAVRGERVLVAAEKTREFLFAYFGAHLAGLVAVPLDPECNPERLAGIASFTEARFVCGNFVHGDVVAKLSRISPRSALVGGEDEFRENVVSEQALADIVFTTGTTGAPKGVCLTQVNLSAAARHINDFVGTEGNDTEVVALPICHSFGLGRVRCLLSVGATVVFVNGFAAVKKLFRALDQNRATGFAMVPASWAYLKKMSGERIAEFGKTLRYVEIGSAPMPTEDKRLLMRLLPNTRICMHYGLTEASRSAFCEFHECAENLETIGRAAPHVAIAVFDENGVPVPAGTPGEICVRGEHVSPGYWRDENPGAHCFEGGFFRTGDLGCENADGTFSLVGRIKEIVNVGGKKVSPQEVEEALNSLPEIAESACVGVPDPSGMLGEALKACLVPAPGFYDAAFPSDAELRARLAPLLETFKIPSIFVRVPAIPKTASGKLQRRLLKD